MSQTPPPSPIAALAKLFEPPAWLIDEVQHRLVLLLNHVLQQESEAQARLCRQKGRIVRMEWRSFAINLIVTPAGLADRAPLSAAPDLTLTVTQDSPLDLLRKALASEKPDVRIEGDVQLAAEVNWLADNLRWDVEEDLSRILGDAPAHAVAGAARRAASALRSFVAGRRPADTAAAPQQPA